MKEYWKRMKGRKKNREKLEKERKIKKWKCTWGERKIEEKEIRKRKEKKEIKTKWKRRKE